jgi:hypothetical protein
MRQTRRNRLLVLAAALLVAIFVVPTFGLPYGGIDFLEAQVYYTATQTPTPTPTPTATPAPSGGGGSTTTTTTAGSISISNGQGVASSKLSSSDLTNALISGGANDQPATASFSVPANSDFTVVNHNVGVEGSAGTLPSGATINFGPPGSSGGFAARAFGQLAPAVPVPGGPAQFSPNGTIFDMSIKDGSGNLITTFAAPLTVVFRFNAADLAMAKNNPSVLTAAYLLDANSPPIENPNHYPIGTWVFFAPSVTTLDTTNNTVTVNTQAVGSTLSVFSNPVGYVQTLSPSTPELSSFDPATSQTFGTKPQFSYLQVVEPQIGGRLLVLDPDSGNYTYVNASDVGPSGPPPPRSSAAVVRGARS